MSKPRYLPLHHAVHATRKTRDNLPFFAPQKDVVHAIRFVLAVAAERYLVGIVAFAIMGNHIHILIFDEDVFSPHANRVADFVQFVYSTLALFTGQHWEIKGAKFDPDSTGNLTLLADHHAELETAAYINLNPVEAAIVADPFRTDLVGHTDLYLRGERIERPETWFSPRSWPESAVLRLKLPPCAEAAGYDHHSWAKAVAEATAAGAASIQLAHKREGKRFTGVLHAARQTPARGPISEHKADHTEAILKGSGAAAARLYAAYHAFQRAYRRSWEQLCRGDDGVTFPVGTYKMVRQVPGRARPLRVIPDVARWMALRMLDD